MSEKTALRGMGVTISDNRGFKLAKTNDKLHGIVIDDTPAGQYGRIALSGKFFSMEKGVGLLFEDGRTNYGSKRCSFEISPRQDGMFVKVDYDENADQLLQWIDANHVELIQS